MANHRVDCHNNSFTETDKPWSESAEYQWMRQFWKLPDDLLGGKDCMRARGEQWLPKEPNESKGKYDNRIQRSFLNNGYKKALKNIAAKPFSQPVKIEGELSEQLSLIEGNADQKNTSITSFAQTFFQDGTHRGVCHIFVDYPNVEEGQNLKDQREQEIRPYFILIKAEDLIGWKIEKTKSGSSRLTQIRFRESVTTNTGKYNSVSQERVRVFNAPVGNEKGTFEVYVKPKNHKEGDEWVLDNDASGTHTYPGIPLATCYISEEEEIFVTRPTLEELADTNLAHWQSNSDQRNILRFARTGVVTATGVTDEEVKAIVWGPDQVIASTSVNAKIGVLEYEGKSIEHGRADLKDLEQQMEILGMSPFIDKARATATEVVSENSQSETVLQSWVRLLENTITWAYQIAAKWVGEELPEDFKVNIFSEFGITTNTESGVTSLIAMREKKLITEPTFLKEVKRRGVLSEDVDVEKETVELEEEKAQNMELLQGGDDTVDNTFPNSDDED